MESHFCRGRQSGLDVLDDMTGSIREDVRIRFSSGRLRFGGGGDIIGRVKKSRDSTKRKRELRFWPEAT